MSAHQIPYNMDRANYEVPDPGDGNPIQVTSHAHVALQIGSGSETSSLGVPVKAGQRVALIALNISGGSRAVQSDTEINANGDDTMTFATKSDACILESFESAALGSYKWRIVYNDGVALS